MHACHQAPRRLTGAQHDGAAWLVGLAVGLGPGVLPDHAVGHAHHAERGNAEQRVQQQHGARHRCELGHQHRHGTEQPGRQAGQRDAPQIVKTKIAPDAARHAAGRQAQQVGRHHAKRHVVVIPGPAGLVALKTQPDQVSQVPAQQHGGRVGQPRNPTPLRMQGRHGPIKPAPDLAVAHGNKPP